MLVQERVDKKEGILKLYVELDESIKEINEKRKINY